MKITVKIGKLNKIHISVDGEYRFTVDSDFWYSEKWHNIKEIDENELAALESAVSFRRAYNAALNLLNYRDHGKTELYKKLIAKKVPKDAAEFAVEKLCEQGLINDADYAKRLACDLFERKKHSPKRVKQELLSRGIDRDNAEEAISELDFFPELRIIELLKNKYSRYLSDEKGRKKVFNALLRLGYNYSEINSALRQFGEDT